jgi:hypothetical protein
MYLTISREILSNFESYIIFTGCEVFREKNMICYDVITLMLSCYLDDLLIS